MRAFVAGLALLAGPAVADRIDMTDGFAADLRAVLPCPDAGFIKSPTSALAFCGAPVPSVEFILVPPGEAVRESIARLESSCGTSAQACEVSLLDGGWLARETQAGHVHTTVLLRVGPGLLEIRSLAADTDAATRTARAALAVIKPRIDAACARPD